MIVHRHACVQARTRAWDSEGTFASDIFVVTESGAVVVVPIFYSADAAESVEQGLLKLPQLTGEAPAVDVRAESVHSARSVRFQGSLVGGILHVIVETDTVSRWITLA